MLSPNRSLITDAGKSLAREISAAFRARRTVDRGGASV